MFNSLPMNNFSLISIWRYEKHDNTISQSIRGVALRTEKSVADNQIFQLTQKMLFKFFLEFQLVSNEFYIFILEI
jgi:hypothetical protein